MPLARGVEQELGERRATVRQTMQKEGVNKNASCRCASVGQDGWRMRWVERAALQGQDPVLRRKDEGKMGKQRGRPVLIAWSSERKRRVGR